MAFLKGVFYQLYYSSFASKVSSKDTKKKDQFADKSTSFYSPRDSIQCPGTYKKFLRKWNNDARTQQMLFNIQNTATRYQTTDITKNLVVWLDRITKFKIHVDQLKVREIFTEKNFKYILNQAIRTSSRLKLFDLYILPKIDYNSVLWYKSKPSSLIGL